MLMMGCLRTHTGDGHGAVGAQRSLIMVIPITLGVSALVELLGYVLIVGSAFLD